MSSEINTDPDELFREYFELLDFARGCLFSSAREFSDSFSWQLFRKLNVSAVLSSIDFTGSVSRALVAELSKQQKLDAVNQLMTVEEARRVYELNGILGESALKLTGNRVNITDPRFSKLGDKEIAWVDIANTASTAYSDLLRHNVILFVDHVARKRNNTTNWRD